MKLSLCLIVKNEEKTLPTLLGSIVNYVDEVVITDTGSTDKTKEVCEKYCKDKLVWTEFEWTNNFADARNFNFSKASGDWILWADADDEILHAENLRQDIFEAKKNDVNALMYPYHYAFDAYGNTTVLQNRERVFKNGGYYKWIGALHEAMIPTSRLARAVRLNSVVWKHRTTLERVEESTKRNVVILEQALTKEIEEDNVDPRTLYNLGNSYFTIGQYQKAIGCYQKYIPMSGWLAEQYLAQHRTALAYYHLEDYSNAIQSALLALQMQPAYPDAYIDLAKFNFHTGQHNKALYWILEAEKKSFPEDLPAVNPMDYSSNIDFLAGHCYIQLGEYKKALARFKAYKKNVPNKSVNEIIKTLEDGVEESANVTALARVAHILKEAMPWSAVPRDYLEYPEVAIARNEFPQKKESTGKDVAIYCGKSPTEWDPNSETKGGIGGSEEAVINLARLLAKRGWNITVYGRPITPGVYDGVDYRHFTDYNPRDKWDIVVGWRNPTIFNSPHNSGRNFVWLHDCTPEDSFTPENLKNIEKIFVLSNYHRSLYPNIPDEKFVLSGNGINEEKFTGLNTKKKNYCINTSAADRGLETLLTLWPKIREKVPKAELHWFYGWEVFDKLHEGNDGMMQWKAKIQNLLKQPGVYEEGRVDHNTIVKKYEQAQLWLYPTEFTEIYCITADKAQAGGALPVTTNVAALAERVKYGTVLPYSDIYTNEEAQNKFVEAVIHYLQNPEEVELEREGMREYAKQECSWTRIADQWDTIFKA